MVINGRRVEIEFLFDQIWCLLQNKSKMYTGFYTHLVPKQDAQLIAEYKGFPDLITQVSGLLVIILVRWALVKQVGNECYHWHTRLSVVTSPRPIWWGADKARVEALLLTHSSPRNIAGTTRGTERRNINQIVDRQRTKSCFIALYSTRVTSMTSYPDTSAWIKLTDTIFISPAALKICNL